MPIKSGERYLIFHYTDGTRDEFETSRLLEYCGDGNGARHPERYLDFIHQTLEDKRPFLISKKNGEPGKGVFPTAVQHVINTGLVKKVEVAIK